MEITEKDVYEELWHGRNFELKYFWQRAIFLSAFLSGCYIAYWTLLLKLIYSSADNFALCNTLAIIVTLIGMGVSVLWILMSKGSKAWYEQWENAIYQFAEEHLIGKDFSEDDPKTEYINWVGFHSNGNVNLGEDKVPDHSIWTTRSGKFSPSRINISIGQLSLILFVAAFIGHVAVRLKGLKSISEVAQVIDRIPDAVVLLVPILVAVLFFRYVRHNLVSHDL